MDDGEYVFRYLNQQIDQMRTRGAHPERIMMTPGAAELIQKVLVYAGGVDSPTARVTAFQGYPVVYQSGLGVPGIVYGSHGKECAERPVDWLVSTLRARATERDCIYCGCPLYSG